MASRTVKSHAVEVLPAVPCGTPWEMPCKRACCGSKLPKVVVAEGLMEKNWSSHSAGWNDVDIARFKGPVTVEAICTCASTEGGGGGGEVILPPPQPAAQASKAKRAKRQLAFINSAILECKSRDRPAYGHALAAPPG